MICTISASYFVSCILFHQHSIAISVNRYKSKGPVELAYASWCLLIEFRHSVYSNWILSPFPSSALTSQQYQLLCHLCFIHNTNHLICVLILQIHPTSNNIIKLGNQRLLSEKHILMALNSKKNPRTYPLRKETECKKSLPSTLHQQNQQRARHTTCHSQHALGLW